MTVEDRKVIDWIGTDTSRNTVVLSVSDHLDWEPADEARLVVLQDKLNDYLAFIESGEIYERFPDAKGRAIEIKVLFMHEPSVNGLAFLNRVTTFFASTDIGFTWRHT